MVIIKSDLMRRKAFAAYEIKRKAFQAIIANQNFDISTRWWANIEKSKLPRRSSLCRIHNHCIQTYRSRSVISFYKLSRLRLRKLAARGDLSGLRKASW
uniref:Ribosomal protein S14 n=1 Tax=Protohalopteris sp. TaxID=2843287 RepID=A0A8F0K087_9PHAE|nr:ribosomal protein S14 [Protohalopteris sp.]